MTGHEERKIITIECTRRVTLELETRGDAEKFVAAINNRSVKLLEDGTLIDGNTGDLLGKILNAVNERDYAMADNQWPASCYADNDPHGFDYNKI